MRMAIPQIDINKTFNFVLDEYKRNTPDSELIDDVKNVAAKQD